MCADWFDEDARLETDVAEDDEAFPIHLPDRCPACDGSGLIQVPVPVGSYAEEPDYTLEICPDCWGTGDPICDICHRNIATAWHATDDEDLVMCCGACTPEEMRRFLEGMRAARQRREQGAAPAVDLDDHEDDEEWPF